MDQSTLAFEAALIETLLAANPANQSEDEKAMQTYVFVARSFGDLATENIFRFIMQNFNAKFFLILRDTLERLTNCHTKISCFLIV